MKKFGLSDFMLCFGNRFGFFDQLQFQQNWKNIGGVQGSGTSKTEKRNVSGFTKIDASGAVNVEVVVGKSLCGRSSGGRQSASKYQNGSERRHFENLQRRQYFNENSD